MIPIFGTLGSMYLTWAEQTFSMVTALINGHTEQKTNPVDLKK